MQNTLLTPTIWAPINSALKCRQGHLRWSWTQSRRKSTSCKQQRSTTSRSDRVSVISEIGTPVEEGYENNFPTQRAPRRAGIILHPTSLPGPYGIGDMGPEAYAFVDWLSEAKLQIWQVLPLVPPGRPIPGVREDYWSPYSGRDAHCGNTLMISLDMLVEDGLLKQHELPHPYGIHSEVNFAEVALKSEPKIALAAKRLVELPAGHPLSVEFSEFRARSEVAGWLEEAALFDFIDSLPELIGKYWWDWPPELHTRDPKALETQRAAGAAHIDNFCATQFLFHRQWLQIKRYANSKGIAVVGDMPIYVGGHSADVWAHQSLFELTDEGLPAAVAGTPPDAFSADGQLWGNPLYDWPAHEREGYSWWSGRLHRALELHDEVRIDHFRAFAAYWKVDAGAETAKGGSWVVGPRLSFFEGVAESLGDAPIVAEDLGVITKDVVDLREAIGAPGMVVLQFAWGSDGRNPHLPHNHYENSFCYPGTHDNETSQGWYDAQDDATKLKLAAYGCLTENEGGGWGLIRMGMQSVSKACVFTMQDVLSLGNNARMNTPGVAEGNWAWRLGTPGCFARMGPEARKLAQLVKTYDRMVEPDPPIDEEPVATNVVDTKYNSESGDIIVSSSTDKNI